MSLRLEDMELIRQLKYRYMRSIDTADAGLLWSCFTKDAAIRFQGGSYRIFEDGRDAIVRTLNSNFNEKMVAQHIANHPEITVHSAVEAEAIWTFTDIAMDLGRMLKFSGSGLYRDRYRKEEGIWKIAASSYERIYELVEEIKEFPNLTAHYLGTLDRGART